MASFTKEKFWAELDSLGEDEVRARIAIQRYSGANYERPLAEEWLRLKDEARALASSAKRDAREEETLSIARNALAVSERANEIADAARIDSSEANSLAQDSNSIAREANSIALNARSEARRANIIAIIAMILTGIIAIIAASDKFIAVLQWLRSLKP